MRNVRRFGTCEATRRIRRAARRLACKLLTLLLEALELLALLRDSRLRPLQLGLLLGENFARKGPVEGADAHLALVDEVVTDQFLENVLRSEKPGSYGGAVVAWRAGHASSGAIDQVEHRTGTELATMPFADPAFWMSFVPAFGLRTKTSRVSWKMARSRWRFSSLLTPFFGPCQHTGRGGIANGARENDAGWSEDLPLC